jgi:ABC-2 type transport system permease protein
MFPVSFMPPSFQAILKFLPFPYELYFPIAIFMGQVHGAELWEGLVIQFCWVLMIGLGARTLWQQGLKRYQAVGG